LSIIKNQNDEIMTATFKTNVTIKTKVDNKSFLLSYNTGETFLVESETKNSIKITKNGITKFIGKWAVELK
jgi:hypothetical protein